MKVMKHSRAIAWLTSFSLAISLSAGILTAERASAAPKGGAKKASKVSSDLNGRKGGETVKVIMQLSGKMSGQLNALLSRNDVHVKSAFKNFNAQAIEMPASIVDQVAAFDEVSYISVDRETTAMGHVSLTTGADAVRQPTNTSDTLVTADTTTSVTTTNSSVSTNTSSTSLDGSGIGIAVLDSGIYASHKSFQDKNYMSRVVFSKDFTGLVSTNDDYGHGSHVASIAAGNGMVSSGAYLGIAPNARIINLRVLDSNGAGSVSVLLSGLDWIMSNHAAYNIRVVNISLGTPAVDSYKNDPVCKAVRRLVDAGVVVVAAAGNNGKTATGQKVYGAIHSPGIEPSAITVGASSHRNPRGCAHRNNYTNGNRRW